MFRATVPAATVISGVLNFGQVICRLGDNYRVWLSRVLESGPHTQRPNPAPIFLEVLPPRQPLKEAVRQILSHQNSHLHY